MKNNRRLKITCCSVGMALILAIVIAINCLAFSFSESISNYFYGNDENLSEFNTAIGNETCLEIESEGIVLLKNENGALPLKESEKNAKGKYPVSVFGWGATDGGFITSGSGSGGSAERGAGKLVTFLNALEGQDAISDKNGNELLPAVEGKFEYYHPLMDMYKEYKSGRDAGDYWNAAYPFFNLIEPAVDKVQQYISGAVAHSSTAIVVFSRVGGEGQDIPRIQKKYNQPEDTTKSYLQLSTEEEDMLALVKENFEKVIVIINACNAMDLSFLDDEGIDAAISVSGGGQSGTVAIAKVLAGEINPSGRTVDTYAYDLTTAATYANAPDCREVNGPTGGERTYTNDGSSYIDYAEGIYIGYKWYETADSMNFWSSDYAKNKWGVERYEDVVQYPFGYGLSYTGFDWDVVSVEPASGSSINADTEIKIQVKVTNAGSVPGKDVVEVYYNPEYHGTVEKSSVNLVAFGKTELLGEGENQILTLTFKASDMKSYDTHNASGAVGDNGGYVLEHGTYEISLRTDCHNVYDSDDATIAYTVENDIAIDAGIAFNRFTGSGVVSGDVSIDGSDTNEGITYLTRADFEGTFPNPREARARASNMPANGWLTDLRDVADEDKPTQGKSGDLKLYNSGNELNLELVLRLGKDYDDPLWDSLLDQITIGELYGVVQGGGFRTKAIKSINKPEHMDLDGPSGLNQEDNHGGPTSALWTSFPVATALAQSWNTKLSYKFGLAIGYEAYATGVAGWYAPGANIHRSPFNGRNFEYYSEDPLLSGAMCAQTVRGATNNGLYCYVKHFAVNETENRREGLYTWLNEQSLREIYLRPFEITVKEGNANAIMSAFNRVGATWSGGNYSLLTGVLREEWGFKGSVITDYALPGQMYFMDVDQGLRAGNDFWLNGLRTDTIGTISEQSSATIISLARTATKNVLYTFCNTVYRQSLFIENPDVSDSFPISEITGKAVTSKKVPKTWIWGIVALDVVTVVGLGLWSYFLFFKKSSVK